MIYFTLEDFYYSKKFIELFNKHSNWFKNKNIAFSSIKGTVPFNTWNGGINNMSGKTMVYPKLKEYFDNQDLPLRLDFSSILLKEDDFHDVMSNAILELIQNKNFSVELSNMKLINYIKKNYEGINFVFSKLSNILFPLDTNIVNSLIESNQFTLISLPEDYSSFGQIENKNKIEVSINSTCPMSCKNRFKCIVLEQTENLNYSNNSAFLRCKNCYNFNSLDSDLNKYLDLGINHFLINAMIASPEKQAYYLIEYFIKPEYQLKAYHLLTSKEKI